MKTLDLIFEVPDIQSPDGEKTSQEWFLFVIEQIVLAYAQKNRGLTEDERYKYYKLKDAFKVLSSSNGAGQPKLIELEDEHYKFLRKCKKEGLMLPNDLMQRVEELIDKADKKT